MTGMVLVTPPDIPDSLLLFNEGETRQIFKFFWPHLCERIDAIEITDERRRLAQQLLIVGIDSSYALGFIAQLKGMLSPQRSFTGLAVMGGKLAAHHIKHWWKHATQNDLKKPRVAEAVRATIADNFRIKIDEAVENASARPRLHPFYMATIMTTFWGEA